MSAVSHWRVMGYFPDVDNAIPIVPTLFPTQAAAEIWWRKNYRLVAGMTVQIEQVAA